MPLCSYLIKTFTSLQSTNYKLYSYSREDTCYKLHHCILGKAFFFLIAKVKTLYFYQQKNMFTYLYNSKTSTQRHQPSHFTAATEHKFLVLCISSLILQRKKMKGIYSIVSALCVHRFSQRIQVLSTELGSAVVLLQGPGSELQNPRKQPSSLWSDSHGVHGFCGLNLAQQCLHGLQATRRQQCWHTLTRRDVNWLVLDPSWKHQE